MYIGDITAAEIVRAQLRDKELELFVRKLLEAELELRHAATAEVRGPVARYRGDDQRDLIVRVADEPKTPRTSFHAPLTWDERDHQTWYSCKGGGSWARSFLDELGRATADSGEPPSRRVEKRPSEPLLDHLSKGRRFVFVIAEPTLDDDDFLARAESVLGYWLDHERGGRPATLRRQLHVIDAHVLARFIATHKPTNLPEDLRRSLGLDVPEGFQGWERWTKQLGGRELPEFESDSIQRPAHERFVDRALARELLESPEDQPWVLSWLLDPQAHRSRSFWRALGFVDQERVIRGQLLALMRQGASAQALTDYLLGWSDDEGPEAPEAWLEQCSEDSCLAPAFIGFSMFLPPSIPRLLRLRDSIASGAPADGLWLLVHHGWAEVLDIDAMLPLVRVLETRGDLGSIELPLIVQLLERNPVEPARRELLERLEKALATQLEQRVVIASQAWYERGVLSLAREGRFDVIVALLVEMLDVSGNPTNVGLGHTLVATLVQGGFAEPLWPHVASAMLERPHSLLGLQLAEEKLLAHLSAEHVLAWVGDDRRRALLVARLCNPHDGDLDEITRQLLVRFEGDDAVAGALEARARSTPGVMVGERVDFERRQRAHASRWAEDPQPAVRRWAQHLEEALRRSIEEDEARRELRRKHG